MYAPFAAKPAMRFPAQIANSPATENAAPEISIPNRTLVMGIVNVTPDSFSDGGQYLASAKAIEHGKKLIKEGADIIDVGGESTRPNAGPVDIDTELSRVLPVIKGLVAANIPVSIDTMKAEVAAAAIENGAAIVNDVSGGLADPEMPKIIAQTNIRYIVGHWRGSPKMMDQLATYQNVVSDVCAELAMRQSALMRQGIDKEQIILDPNLGFAKLGSQNWQLIAGLAKLQALGQPILIGASRKRFLKEFTPELDIATAAISAIVATAGIWGVRVHNAKASRIAVEVGRRLYHPQDLNPIIEGAGA